MGNSYFLNKTQNESNQLLRAIFSECDLIIADPPNGFRADILSMNFDLYQQLAKPKPLQIMIFFSYNMQEKILESFHGSSLPIRMFDFRVINFLHINL